MDEGRDVRLRRIYEDPSRTTGYGSSWTGAGRVGSARRGQARTNGARTWLRQMNCVVGMVMSRRSSRSSATATARSFSTPDASRLSGISATEQLTKD